MAILKMISIFHPTKAGTYTTLMKGINYLLNDKKTNNGLYTSSLNCNTKNALEDMIATRKYYGKESNNTKDRIGYHWTISWLPEEHVDYGVAMEIAKEFCEKYLHDYECVYSVHTDKAHTHAHLIFNSVNFNTGRKFRYENGDWAKMMQPLLDEICQKHGLHTLQMDTGMTNEQYYQEHMKKGKNPKSKSKNRHYNKSNNKYYNERTADYTKSEFVKKDIDDAILSSHSLLEFFMLLEEWGYKIKHGKSEKYGDYFAVKGRGMERFRRNYALGKGYGLDSIKKRIEIKNNPLPELEHEEQPDVDMRNYLFGFVYWKKVKSDIKLTSLQKKFYVQMYHTGIDKDIKNRNYYKSKEALKEIRKIENNIEIIYEYNIADSATAQKAIDKINAEVNRLDNEKKNIYKERKPYMPIINAYKELQTLEPGYYMYLNGIKEYKEQYERYVELKNVVEKYGFSKIEIEEYAQSVKDKVREINVQKRKLNKKIASIEDIEKEIEILDYNYEKEYSEIPETENEREIDVKDRENQKQR